MTSTPDRPASDSRPRVSVAMVTFRHGAWIGEAIESVLAQDFDDWEIVIADDQSDDDTLEVARTFAERCSSPGGQRLRILPALQKYGRRPNFERLLLACRGEFIAHLDGDDFFVDPAKLSKQVALLDADPSIVGVFGAWHETDPAGVPVGEPWRGYGLRGRTRFSAADFGSHCITTSCVALFRRLPFGDLPQWWRDCDVGDWPLHMLNALHGDYAYLDEVLAAHRNHGEGVWSAQSDRAQMESMMRTHELFLKHIDEPPLEAVREKILRGNWGRARQLLQAGDAVGALEFLEFCARHRRSFPSRWKLALRTRRARRAASRSV